MSVSGRLVLRILRCLTAGAFFGLLGAIAGAESSPDKADLFIAGTGGYAAYRIPALVTTPQGPVLAAAEARKNGGGDWGRIDIVCRRSLDGGRTWEPAQALVAQTDLPADVSVNPAEARGRGPAAGFTIGNPTWITESRSGRTFLLFCVEYMRCFVVESTDGGAIFSKPREITPAFADFRQRDRYPWKVIATGPGHGAQLASGRLVVPVWLSTSETNGHHPSACGTIYSDDGGVTWQAGAIAAGRDDGVPDPSETAIAEVAPGRVLLSIRQESPRHRRVLAWGADGATGWSRPEFSETLWEPVCMASLIRLPGGALIFSNPASLEANPSRPGAVGRQRRNLGLRTSHDQGKTWSEPFILTPGPSAYSDLAVTSDGTLLCFYENGGQSAYEKLSVARVSIDRLPGANP